MVKFGRHLQFYLEDDKDQCNCDEPYIVQYTDIKELIGDSQEKFTKEWQNSLSVATQDYNKRVRLLWDTIFDGLFRYVHVYIISVYTLIKVSICICTFVIVMYAETI